MFDTHGLYQALRGGGFNDDQAETLTAALGRAFGGSLATKADITESEGRLRLEMERSARNLYLQLAGTVGLMLALAQYAAQHAK